MREYGTVSPKFWIGATGKSLRGDPEAQVLAMYLMTSPHSTMTGVFHCPVLYMAHETGLGMEGASKALARLIEAGFCEYEEASEFVFVVRMAAHQIAESLKPGDKRILGLTRAVENMPEGRIRSRFLAIYAEAFLIPKAPEVASPSKAPCKPLPSQEQEQEQEKETCASDESRVADLPAKKAERERVTAELFAEFWTAYPRKRAKDEALKAFSRRKPDRELLAAMLAALAKQSASEDWQRDEGKFIPYPATWINGGRWLDDDQARVADDRFAGAI
jgi:hypothetical protein